MSTEINADSSNDGEYNSRLLRRKVRKPTPVLYNMIKKVIDLKESENLPIRKKPKYEKLYKDKKYQRVLEDQICERCKTHPDDVNWIDPYHHSPFWLCVSTGYYSMMDKAFDAMIESDSFRVFDELHILHREEEFEYLNIEVHEWFIKKLIVLKPNDVIKVFKKHDLSLDVATVIVSFLYGEKEQLAALNVITNERSLGDIKCPSTHLIDDWISVNQEVLSNKEIFGGMIRWIFYCTKACCALMLLRNIKISIKVQPVPRNDLSLLQGCVSNCLKNKFICMSNDTVKLSLEILDLGLDRSSEEELFNNGNTILHAIACTLELGEGCCKDKWLSFLSKIVDRFPVEVLSMQNSIGYTPYDFACRFFSQDKNLMKEVLEIFKPR